MRQVNTFVAGMVVGGGLLLAGLVLGAAGPEQLVTDTRDVIRAGAIELLDERGAVAGRLAVNDDGSGIELRNGDGVAVFNVIATADGAELRLADETGKRHVELRSGEGGGSLMLGGTETGGGVRLDLDSDGDGRLTALGEAGKPIARLFSNVVGSGVVETYRADGRRLTALTSTVGDHGQISTYDGDGSALVLLTAGANADGQIRTFSAEGRHLGVLSASDTGATLRLYNREGATVLTAEADDEGSGEVGVWDAEGRGRVITPIQ